MNTLLILVHENQIFVSQGNFEPLTSKAGATTCPSIRIKIDRCTENSDRQYTSQRSKQFVRFLNLH